MSDKDKYEYSASSETDAERTDTDETIRSSRAMPVPDYLQGRGPRTQNLLNEGDELPPPSYEEATRSSGYESPDITEESSATGEGATGSLATNEDSVLSPDEIAIVLKMQSDREQYLPERRGSYEEAIEMLYSILASDISLETSFKDVSNDMSLDRILQEKNEKFQTVEFTSQDLLASNLYKSSSKLASPWLSPIQPEDRELNNVDDNVDSAKPVEEVREALNNVDTIQPRRQSFVHMELAETSEQSQARRKEFSCTSCGYLNEPITWVGTYLKNQSQEKLILIGVLVFCILGLLLFVSLFPASFVYIEYHQVALPQSKMTNKIDRSTVYYPGCYVLGPDTTLVRFQASAHVMTEQIDVFTLDTIIITMKFNLVYFLRQKEVGALYSKFLHDYDEVFRLIVKSTIKNLAGTSLTVDQFRFNRTFVEKEMHNMLRKRLGGECCPECCLTRECQSNTYCSQCKKDASCHPGYHVDVRYFSLLSVGIPDSVFERYLRFTILEIEKEKEFFLQDHAIIEKETSLLTQQIQNQAEEIIDKGRADSEKHLQIAAAEKEKTVQSSYVTALKDFFITLDVSRQDHKQSLMMIRAMEDNIDNIYLGYGYNESILYAN